MRRAFALCTLVYLVGVLPAAAQVNAAVTFSAPQCQAPGIGNVVLTASNPPAPTLQGQFDIIVVADGSGSISSQDFMRLRSFLNDLANTFTFGDAATRMGLVVFGDDAGLVTGLTSQKAVFINAINGMVQPQGGTCTGCGMALAVQLLQDFSRPDAEAIIVTITDGQANVFTQTIESAAAAADTQGYTRVAVGIGNVSLAELGVIASEIPGRQTVFTVGDFVSLGGLLQTFLTGLFGGAPTPPAALDVAVNLVVNSSLMLLGATSELGVVTRNGNEILWTIPAVPYGTSTLSFSAAAPTGPGAMGLAVFSTATYQSGSDAITQIQSPTFDLPACAGPEPDPDIDELLAQLEICQVNTEQLADELAAANARIAALEGEATVLHGQRAALEAQVSALQQQVSTFESQVAALQAQIAGLQTELAAAQAALAATNIDAQAKAAVIGGAVSAVEQALREAFRVPGFTVPGTTPEQQLQNLVSAITALNKGRLEGIFEALGGK